MEIMNTDLRIKRIAATVSLSVVLPAVIFGNAAYASSFTGKSQEFNSSVSVSGAVPGTAGDKTQGCSISDIVPQAIHEEPEGLRVKYLDMRLPESAGCDQSNIAYMWDFGDGASFTVTEPAVFHVYETSGSYDVSVRIVDLSTGLKSKENVETVTVKDIDPVAVIRPVYPEDENDYDAGALLILDGEHSGSRTGKKIVSYLWDNGETASQTEHVFSANDRPDTVVLTVTDETGASDTREQRIYPFYHQPACGVSPLNTMWLHFVTEKNGLKVNFSEYVSDDINGACPVGVDDFRLPHSVPFGYAVENNYKNIEYLWDFGDGTFSDQKAPVHDYEQAGTYHVGLVYRVAGIAHTATQTVTVEQNAALSGDIKAVIKSSVDETESVFPGREVTLDASGSVSKNGNISSYRWSTGETASKIIVNPDETTAYTVTVLDDNNNISTAVHTIMVDAGKMESVTVDVPYYGKVHKNIEVRKGTKLDIRFLPEHCAIMTCYPITLTDGFNILNGLNITGIIDQNSEFAFHSSNTDTNNATPLHHKAKVTVRVVNGKGPVASISANRLFAAPGDEVIFSGVNSEGDSLSYEWMMNGNRVSTEKEFSRVFDYAGTHVITLRVTDADGNSGTATDILIIEEPYVISIPEEFKINVDKELAKVGETVSFGIPSYEDDYARFYQWFIDAEIVAETEEASASYVFSTPGTHEIKVVAHSRINGGWHPPYTTVKNVVINGTSDDPAGQLELVWINAENEKKSTIPFVTSDSDARRVNPLDLTYYAGEISFSVANIRDEAVIRIFDEDSMHGQGTAAALRVCPTEDGYFVTCETDDGNDLITVADQGIVNLKFVHFGNYRIRIEATLANDSPVVGYIPVKKQPPMGALQSRKGGALSPLSLAVLILAGIVLRRRRQK